MHNKKNETVVIPTDDDLIADIFTGSDFDEVCDDSWNLESLAMLGE